VIALTKADLLDDNQRAKLLKRLEKAVGKAIFPISAPLDDGVEPLLDTIIERLGDVARESREAAADEKLWTPL